MQRLRRLLPVALPDWAVAVLVAIAVAAIVLGLRAARTLEQAELAGYDRFLRIRAPGGDAAPDPRIVIVTISERDIQEQGTWPLPRARHGDPAQRRTSAQPMFAPRSGPVVRG